MQMNRRVALAALTGITTALRGGEKMTVRDLDGKAVDITLGQGVTVIAFISTQCPISNDYNDRMSAVYKEYSAQGVKFYFLNANSTEPAGVVKEHRESAGFPFPVYKDDTVVEKLGASVTPETFVFNQNGERIYHGYIDDSRNAARVTKQSLRDAIEASLAGKAAPVAETKAFGCTIKRARKSS
jgi:thiol-disulfide isomerase/thioredoxin